MATIKSIEQKAQRYDEAVEKLRRLHDNYDTVSTLIDIKEELENIFPELKKSEDEKIRNRLINYLKVDLEEHPAREKRINEMLAWLEKKTEQKLYVNDNAKEMFIKALERVEEQNNKGYKLTDCDKNSWWEDFKAYTSCIIEQNPTWSEEDEYCRHQLIAFCENCMAQDACSKRCAHWLKSLKDRVQPQPKQEWSEEDEKMLNSFQHKLEVCDLLSNKECIWIKYKLKSIRPQSTWKPADGDDLPEYDREVIAILDYDFGHYKVVYAHRPNPNGWDGTNIDTGEKEHFEPATYSKGGWNQPHILYWLDARLPYEEK